MNNIEKIKAKIEKLYDGEAPKHDQQCNFDDGYFTGLATILNLIDSMSEEKPSEDLEEEIKSYFEGLWPGTETPEQCNTDLHFTPPAIIRLVRHFTEWQKKQIMKVSEEDALLLERAWLTLDNFGHEELAEWLRQFVYRQK